ncbi:MAG: hypothetical protein AAFS10_05040, partial [Myxococcota bacterium]
MSYQQLPAQLFRPGAHQASCGNPDRRDRETKEQSAVAGERAIIALMKEIGFTRNEAKAYIGLL